MIMNQQSHVIAIILLIAQAYNLPLVNLLYQISHVTKTNH